MALRWYETSSKLVAHGTVKHSVWQAFAASGFYAKSGMDVHGPYETASRARKACADIEEAEAANHIDAQAATIKALVEALKPFCFYDEDDPSEPVQTAWEMMYLDRFKEWIDFGDIESARATLAAAKENKTCLTA